MGHEHSFFLYGGHSVTSDKGGDIVKEIPELLSSS